MKGEYLPLIGDLCIEVVKGHIDTAEFWKIIEIETGMPEGGTDPPRHTYARLVPVQNEEWDLKFIETTRPGRGAFPVTIVDVDW